MGLRDFEARVMMGWLVNTLRVFASSSIRMRVKVKRFCF